MALSDYAELKAEVISFTGRDDLSSKFDTFLKLGETAIYSNDDKPLRLSYFETSTTLQTVGGTDEVALPSDYLQLRSLKIEVGGSECELRFNAPNALPRQGAGLPTAYTIIGRNIVFNFTPDGVYDLALKYFAKPTDLDATNNVNSLLTNNPDIYFYACMFSVYDYTTELQEAENYYGKMLRSIRGAIKNDMKGSITNASARYRGWTP